MHHVSSNLTLLVKFFIPTLWTVFFGAFTIAILFSGDSYFGNTPAFLFKVGTVICYLIGLALFYYFLMRLKRIEMDKDFVYATNYFKQYRYSWNDVERISYFDMVLFRFGTVHLKAPGSFGKRFSFLISNRRFGTFVDEYPELVNK